MSNNIIENNKLIAEFMDLKQIEWYSDILGKNELIWVKKEFNESPVGQDDYSENSPFDWANFYPIATVLEYHQSWNWLMDVVSKCFDCSEVNNHLRSQIIASLSGVIDIEDTYQAVVEFIKWYNEQEKDKLNG